jgi:hypothetical protein
MSAGRQRRRLAADRLILILAGVTTTIAVRIPATQSGPANETS